MRTDSARTCRTSDASPGYTTEARAHRIDARTGITSTRSRTRRIHTRTGITGTRTPRVHAGTAITLARLPITTHASAHTLGAHLHPIHASICARVHTRTGATSPRMALVRVHDPRRATTTPAHHPSNPAERVHNSASSRRDRRN
ncbi:hypothetical protein APR12_001665 [Nocardia amikacinitolerans]|uniref:hypothetical protein n=1 Tax=Nocardia amikacinitolerans TaxID=756689 RepID=UPI0008345F9C|nr:hypothetical protein [Nocardia amikacinitolerans]MCP2316328.1 hypothetical protein [Nocardia amikacinitolerans]